jgi:hypothetical protein
VSGVDEDEVDYSNQTGTRDERERERARERDYQERRAEDRRVFAGWVLTGTGVVIVLTVLIAGIVLAVVRNNDQMQRTRVECIERGNSWVSGQCVGGTR